MALMGYGGMYEYPLEFACIMVTHSISSLELLNCTITICEFYGSQIIPQCQYINVTTVVSKGSQHIP